VEGEDLEQLKATLKELNQFILRLRLARPPADRPAGEAREA
jgi:hypothetical protein